MSTAALQTLKAELVEILRPPRRVTVAESCNENLTFNDGENWQESLTPYMTEPMNATAARRHDVVVFMGPARSGKTLSLILGRLVYTVCAHPADTMIVHSSQDMARDFSLRDLRRLHKYSAGMADRTTGRTRDDNTFDKLYRSGIICNIGWPSNTQLASRTLSVMLLTDYDRWPADIDGEGSGFAQARKRTQTAGSAAMTVVESSPGSWLVDDGSWKDQYYELGKPLRHQAPPTVSGVRANIAALYNAGTRSWWYVPCQGCGEYYPQRAAIDIFSWGDSAIPSKAAANAGTICCWCGVVHMEWTKRVENVNGRWLCEGETIDCNGKISGDGRRGKAYPSYWLGGGAAAYQTRASIVQKYLEAKIEAEQTGDEAGLKFCVNADIGAPHKSIFEAGRRAAAPIKQRAEHVDGRVVAEGVRFLIAAIDVQKARFVVQIVGYGPDKERWLIDRYNIRKSDRKGEDGESENVNPAAYAEDWHLLTKNVIMKAYPIENSKLHMAPIATICDSGGAEGVSDNANAYFRDLRRERLDERFRLVKGAASRSAKRIVQTWPDNKPKKSRKAAAGDVPLLLINGNTFKDALNADLQREIPGKGYIHFPAWLGDWFYDELTREKRGPKGWEGIRRNEAWDLFVYADAMAVWGPCWLNQTTPKGIESINWDKPPKWALATQENPFVSEKDQFIVRPRKAMMRKKREQAQQRSGNWLNLEPGKWMK